MAAMDSYVAPSGTRLREAASFNQTLEATAAELDIMVATGNRSSSASATSLSSCCASALR